MADSGGVLDIGLRVFGAIEMLEDGTFVYNNADCPSCLPASGREPDANCPWCDGGGRVRLEVVPDQP